MWEQPKRIIDISQPVSSKSACFPGDTPFSRQVTLTFAESGVVNLTSLTMSPHVGTHADSPVHIEGDLEGSEGMVGNMPLEPFAGPAQVIDFSPWCEAITVELLEQRVGSHPSLAKRLLFKTCRQIRYHVFEQEYAYFSPEFVARMASSGVELLGIDTPSVDHVDSKTLDAHKVLVDSRMVWLENLDLTQAEAGEYFLVALPIRFEELEASPVRAVLFE